MKGWKMTEQDAQKVIEQFFSLVGDMLSIEDRYQRRLVSNVIRELATKDGADQDEVAQVADKTALYVLDGVEAAWAALDKLRIVDKLKESGVMGVIVGALCKCDECPDEEKSQCPMYEEVKASANNANSS